MNNINCEHCGSLIDVSKDKKCTNCGAPYKNNKQYKEYQEYLKKQKELNLESQKLANDITRDVHNTTKKMVPGVFITVLIIFIISFSVFFFIFYNIVKQIEEPSVTNNNYINEYDDELDLNDILDTRQNRDIVSILFNETAYTESYNIKVNKVKAYTEKHFAKNQKLYGFNVVFKNKTENWKDLESIKLVYTDNEGDEQESTRVVVSTSTLDFFATTKKTYEGFVYFEIPDYVKNVTLVYDNIHITINNFRNYIK